MNDTIADLYYGNIQGSDRPIRGDTEEAKLCEIFSDSEDWLTEHLEGKAKVKLLNLLNAHSELVGLLSYENFRRGFVLGARLMLQITEDGDIDL